LVGKIYETYNTANVNERDVKIITSEKITTKKL